VSFRSEFVRPVFFVRWGKAEEFDLPLLGERIIHARNLQRRPVVYVAIVPEDSVAPDAETRRAFIERMDEVLAHCHTMHFVMEGRGFKSAMRRNALGMVLMVRGRRNKIFVHDTLQDALTAANEHLEPEHKFDVEAMMRHVHATQIASGAAHGAPS
jgi:hypothetical protein